MGKAEAKVERHLVKRIKELGGLCLKFTSPSRRFVPDRICILPGRIIFVECKSETGRLSKGQEREIKRLMRLKQIVVVLSSIEEVDQFIEKVETILEIDHANTIGQK